MKCKLCKKMARDLKNYDICSKCRNKTLRELIRDKLINPKIFNNIFPTNKKGQESPPRSLSADPKLIRGREIKESMSEDADNESVGIYKRRWVEDDTLLDYKDEKSL